MLKLKKGIQVKIITGKDKGKTGEIIEINRKLDSVKVKNINIIKKHTKATKEEKLLEAVTRIEKSLSKLS